MEHTNKEKVNGIAYRIDRIKIFFLFFWAFGKFAYQQWKQQSSFDVKEVKDVICLHFHPNLSPEPALLELKKNFVDSYIALHGKDPILVALPYGYKISSLRMDEFISVLNRDQINEMQRSLYRKRDKIEVVSG